MKPGSWSFVTRMLDSLPSSSLATLTLEINWARVRASAGEHFPLSCLRTILPFSTTKLLSQESLLMKGLRNLQKNNI
ncbi:MAG: hypothetical protein WCA35_20245, partial [Kovacikia sp.]